MDYQSAMYDPVYSVLGVAAQLAIGSVSYDLVVMDKTAGVQLGGPVETLSVVPAVTVRMVEVTALGLTRSDFDENFISFNESTWLIRSHKLMPSPKGIGDGELMLVLEEA